MYEIIFLLMIIFVLFSLLALIFCWINLVLESIEIANDTQIKYSFVKAKEVKQWGNKHYFVLTNEKIIVYQNRTNMELLYEIFFPEGFIITTYGIAILSSPIQLALIYKYIVKLKKKALNKDSLYSSDLFKHKFNV